jgi:hypothetical protein
MKIIDHGFLGVAGQTRTAFACRWVEGGRLSERGLRLTVSYS